MSHQITTVNMSDGSVQGHKAGCADLSRGSLKATKQEQYTDTYSSKHAVWLEYNADFLPECEGCPNHDESKGQCDHAYSIDWKACADHVPAFDNDGLWSITLEEGGMDLVESPEVVTTVKRGSKWTYIYVDGQLVAEIRNDQAHLLGAI